MKHLFLIGLVFASLFLAGCTEQALLPTETPTPTPFAMPRLFKEAGTTLGGTAYLTVYGRKVAFKFQTMAGQPINNLSVAYAMDNKTNASVLLVVDPSEKYPPKIFILRGGGATLAPSDDVAYFADSDLETVTIRLDNSRSYVIPEIYLPWIPDALDELGWTEATVLAGKMLDQVYGLPVGKYLENIGVAETTTQTKAEALQEWRDDVKEKAKTNVLFWADPEALISGEFDVPTPKSVFIDVSNLVIDRVTIYSCGLPGMAVTKTTMGPIQIRGCRYLETGEMTEGLVRAAVDGVDQYGQKVGSCSLSLISMNNLGVGFSVPLGPDCKGDVKVPQGDYLAEVGAPGAETKETALQVDADGADLDVTLDPALFQMLATPTLEATLTPAGDVTGKWAGTASFTEDNVFTGVASGTAACTWSGPFELDLYQSGNNVIGYLNKGASANWSSFTFQIKSHEQTVQSTGAVPVVGCPLVEGGVWSEGLDSGTVSSSSIKLNAHGKPTFSGSFTSDQMSLGLTNCLLQAGDTCTVEGGAKWKISLTRQPS